MANARDVVTHVSDFLAHRESLDVLEDWSSEFLYSVYRQGDAVDQKAIHLVRSVLSAFEDSGDAALRKELAAAIRPFERRKCEPQVYGQFRKRFYNEDRKPPVYARSSTRWEHPRKISVQA